MYQLVWRKHRQPIWVVRSECSIIKTGLNNTVLHVVIIVSTGFGAPWLRTRPVLLPARAWCVVWHVARRAGADRAR